MGGETVAPAGPEAVKRSAGGRMDPLHRPFMERGGGGGGYFASAVCLYRRWNLCCWVLRFRGTAWFPGGLMVSYEAFNGGGSSVGELRAG